jgi:hypothetical protein
MRMPRIRFTMRRLMVAVVLIALALAGWIEAGRYRERLRRRSFDYSQTATKHMLKEFTHRRRAEQKDGQGQSYLDMARLAPGSATESMQVAKDYHTEADRLRRLADQEKELTNKYRLASKRPWLPVEPDPPEPK